MARVLIIDDDGPLRNLLVQVLTRAGHKAVSASDGRKGLRLAQSFLPEVVVTDILMPEQEGIETIIALRKQRSELPIIAISGSSTLGPASYLTIAERVGAAYSLPKPFRPHELLTVVERALSESQTKQPQA